MPAKLLQLILLICLCLNAFTACEKSEPEPAEPLSELQVKMLKAYEGIRRGLANDDIETAGRWAREILRETDQSAIDTENAFFDMATEIGRIEAVETARALFKTMSLRARELTRGRPEWQAYECQLARDGLWVQTDEEINNPYSGKSLSKTGNKLR